MKTPLYNKKTIFRDTRSFLRRKFGKDSLGRTFYVRTLRPKYSKMLSDQRKSIKDQFANAVADIMVPPRVNMNMHNPYLNNSYQWSRPRHIPVYNNAGEWF